MSRPDPKDIELCMLGVFNSGRHYYEAAKRVVCNIAGQHYYGDEPRLYSLSDALGREKLRAWAEASYAENCAYALALYKQHYPDG